MKNFKERFDALLSHNLNIRRELIKPEAKFIEDLGVDSLDVAELIVEFEKEFNISISDEEADEFKTVRDAENYLRSKLSGREPSANETIL